MGENNILYVPALGRNLVKIDLNDAENAKVVEPAYLDIDYVWVIEEDGFIKINNKNVQLHKGDFLVKFYNSPKKLNLDDFVVFRNEDLKNRLELIEKLRKEEKEKCCNCDECACDPCSRA